MTERAAHTYDVFISYSPSDQNWVRGEILPRLEAGGLRVCVDFRDFEPGAPRVAEVERAVRESRKTIVVLTPAYLASEWDEFGNLMVQTLDPASRGRRLIPLLKTKCNLPLRIKYLTPVDFTVRKDRKLVWARLLNALDLPLDVQESAPQVYSGPFMAGEVPGNFVPRPVEYEQVIVGLLDNPHGVSVAMTAALRGAGGYGKTTLAKAICHDERVRRTFPDGVLWVTLGQVPGDLIGRVQDLIDALSDERPAFSTIEAAMAHLAELLADRAVLIVLDDVWNAADIKPFMEGGSRCARLITTRDSSTLPPGARHVLVDAMQQDEAIALLGAGLPDGERDPLGRLAARLGEWPLLLTLVNGALRNRVHIGKQLLPDALAYVDRALDKRGLTAFDARNARERDQAVAITLGVSLDLLSADERDRYGELAIFPEDVDIPLAVLEKLWGATGGLDDFDTEELCDRLGHLSLLLRFDPVARIIHLHDVVRAYLVREHEARLPTLHRQFLDAYWTTKDEGRKTKDKGRPTDDPAHPITSSPCHEWANLPPDEPYIWDHLAYHLIEARRDDELVATVKDLCYLATKTHLRGAPVVEADLLAAEEYAPDDVVLRLLRRSFANAAHLLNRCETLTEIAGTLHSRIAHLPELADIAAAGEGGLPHPFITTRHPLPDLPPTALIRTLEGHRSAVNDCVFSPDGTTIVSASADRTLKVWDTRTGALRHTLEGHTGGVVGCAFSADGTTIVSASADRTLKVWDTRTGELRQTLVGYMVGVYGCAFSADGMTIVSTWDDRTLKVWDMRTGTLHHTLEGHIDEVRGCVISADGTTIVSASSDETLKVWDARTGVLRHTLIGHIDGVTSCTISMDRTTIVSGSDIGTLKIWDAHTGALRHSLVGHTSRVSGCAISVDGTTIVSASADRTLKIWDAGTGALRHTLEGHTGEVTGCAISVDGTTIVSASVDGTLKIWAPRTGALRHTLAGYADRVRDCAISADGRTIVSVLEEETLKIYDTHTGAIRLSGHITGVYSCAISADGMTILSVSTGQTLKIWDAHTGDLRNTFYKEYFSMNRYAISADADGTTIVSIRDDDTLNVWDVGTGVLRHTLKGHTNWVNHCAFSADSTIIVSASDDRTLKVWDARTGLLCRTLVGHTGWVRACAISADGTIIVSASDNATLKVWDTGTGACLATLHVDGALYACACSVDGEYIVAAGKRGVYMLRLVR